MTSGIESVTGIEYENNFGSIPGFKCLIEELVPRSVDDEEIEEIYMEREAYLINVDDLLEEMLNKQNN